MASSSKEYMNEILLAKFDESCNVTNINSTIFSLREYRTLSKNLQGKSSDWISEANKLLYNNKTRVKGLLLLYNIVEQCNADVFKENILQWLRKLQQLLQESFQHFDSSHGIAALVAASILYHAATQPELSRQIASQILSQIVTTLIAAQETHVGQLHCLYTCLKYFSSSCGPLKGKIYTFLTTLLFGEKQHQSQILEKAAECYALLPQCGGGGNQGVNHSTAWSNQCDSLLGSLHDILDALYEGFNYDNDRRPQERLPFDFLSSLPTSALQEKLSVICLCLQKLLLADMSAEAKVPYSDIINTACRCLSVNLSHLGTNLNQVELALVLPSVHICFLKVLKSLIICCRKQLMPLGAVINKLIVQTLSWTKTPESCYGQESQFGGLRKTCYELVDTWIVVLGASAGLDLNQDHLMGAILSDISPCVNTIKLRDASGNVSRKRKKSKKAKISLDVTSETVKKVDQQAGAETVVSALRALRRLMYSVGSKLKPKWLKALHEVVVYTLLDVQQEKEIIPYSFNLHCRNALYQVLQACVLAPHPTYPPPLQVAVHLFTNGQFDLSLEVSATCVEALAVCDAVIHPRVPSLAPPIPSTLQPVTLQNNVSPSVRADALLADVQASGSESDAEIFSIVLEKDEAVNYQTEDSEKNRKGSCKPTLDDHSGPNDITEENKGNLRNGAANNISKTRNVPIDIKHSKSDLTRGQTVEEIVLSPDCSSVNVTQDTTMLDKEISDQISRDADIEIIEVCSNKKPLSNELNDKRRSIVDLYTSADPKAWVGLCRFQDLTPHLAVFHREGPSNKLSCLIHKQVMTHLTGPRYCTFCSKMLIEFWCFVTLHVSRNLQGHMENALQLGKLAKYSIHVYHIIDAIYSQVGCSAPLNIIVQLYIIGLTKDQHRYHALGFRGDQGVVDCTKPLVIHLADQISFVLNFLAIILFRSADVDQQFAAVARLCLLCSFMVNADIDLFSLVKEFSQNISETTESSDVFAACKKTEIRFEKHDDSSILEYASLESLKYMKRVQDHIKIKGRLVSLSQDDFLKLQSQLSDIALAGGISKQGCQAPVHFAKSEATLENPTRPLNADKVALNTFAVALSNLFFDGRNLNLSWEDLEDIHTLSVSVLQEHTGMMYDSSPCHEPSTSSFQNLAEVLQIKQSIENAISDVDVAGPTGQEAPFQDSDTSSDEMLLDLVDAPPDDSGDSSDT